MPTTNRLRTVSTWLLTGSLVLFSGASSVVQAAPITPKTAIASLSFLVKDTSATLRYVKLAYRTEDVAAGNTKYHVIEPSNVNSQQTNGGLLITVPNVDWNVSSDYTALVVTDKEVSEFDVTPTIAQPVVMQPSPQRALHADPPAGAHGAFQSQDLFVVYSEDALKGHSVTTTPVFSIRVSPGMMVGNDDRYVTSSFEWLGRDDDHAYFLKPTASQSDDGLHLNVSNLHELNLDMKDTNLTLTSIKSTILPDDLAGAEGSDEVNVSGLSGVYLSQTDGDYFNDAAANYVWNTAVTYSDPSGNTYEYGPLSMQGPQHLDTNFSATMQLRRPIYHPGFTMDSYNDLGLTVSDSSGHRLIHVKSASGDELMGSLNFADGQTNSSVPVSMAGSSVTLPETPNTYTMTYQGPASMPYSVQSSTSLSLKLVPYPADLLVNPIHEGDSFVTGTAEPGMTVELIKDAAVRDIETVQDDGTFSLNFYSDFVPGTLLTVKFTDPSTGYEQTLPVVVEEDYADVATVKDTDTAVTGIAPVGSTVTVSLNDNKVIGHTVVPKTGHFRVSIPKQVGGTILAVTVSNGKTSLGQKTTVVEVQGTLPPKAPVVKPAVTDATGRIIGNAQPGTTVTVMMDDLVIGSYAAYGPYGYFEIGVPFYLKPGTVLTVTATDAWNHTSAPTKVVVLDGTAPDFPTVNPITDTDKYVTGTTEPNATVYVKDVNNKKVFGSGHADKDGSFKIKVSSLVGTQYVRVSAKDAAGNANDGLMCVVKDTTAPKAPRVSTIHHSDQKITITSENGATVYVTVGDGAPTSHLITATNGVITIPVDPLQVGEKIQVYVIDQGGLQSPTTTVSVIK